MNIINNPGHDPLESNDGKYLSKLKIIVTNLMPLAIQPAGSDTASLNIHKTHKILFVIQDNHNIIDEFFDNS